jgi:hypothetical protein
MKERNSNEVIDDKKKRFVEETRKRSVKTIEDLNLIYELDYLGYIEIESKYLQSSIIPWLISTIKLIETNQHIDSIYFKINSKNNCLIACKPPSHNNNNDENNNDDDSDEDHYNERSEIIIFSHKLTNIFKISQLTNDQLCFGYVYRDFNEPNNCRLFAFRSNKVNLVQMLIQLQYKAIKYKQIEEKDLTKKFETEYVGEVSF